MTDLRSLYQTDYSAWADRHAELLRAGRFDELDIEHLLEELADMGRSEREELESRLTVLLAHLLKWQYQFRTLSERWREFKGDSWRATIIEQRERIARRLRKSPGLTSRLDEILREAYEDARALASKESRLAPDTFPDLCPYSLAEMLDEDFYPESR